MKRKNPKPQDVDEVKSARVPWYYCYTCGNLIPIEERGKYTTTVYFELQMAQVNWRQKDYIIHFCSQECKDKDKLEQEEAGREAGNG